MVGKIHFITYGDGRSEFFEGAKRLALQAKDTGWFDSITIWNSLLLDAVDPMWYQEHKDQIRAGSRGHGYWIWKSKIVQIMLEGLPEGDVVVYVDACCELNGAGEKRFKSYLDLVDRFEFLFFYLNGENYLINQWTKAALLKDFNLYDGPDYLLELPQMESGVLFFKNTNSTRDLVSDWQRFSIKDNYCLINDADTGDVELPSFVENRHDQAILSLLFITGEHGIALRNENYFPDMWRKREHPRFSPVAAFRNRSTQALMPTCKLVSADEGQRFLQIKAGKPIYLDSFRRLAESRLDSTLKIQRANAINESSKPHDEQKILDLIQERSMQLRVKELEHGHQLMLSHIRFLNSKVDSLSKNLERKEDVLQSQSKHLRAADADLLAKQSVIESQAITLEQRLDVIAQDARDFIDLRAKIVGLENKLYLSKLSARGKFLHQMRILKNSLKKYFHEAYINTCIVAKARMQQFLHVLRVIKHRSSYFRSDLDTLKRLLGERVSNWCSKAGGKELGYLGTHPPSKLSIPLSYRNVKSNVLNLPTISIITPSFRQGQFIERTINSVLSQNYENLEYIIQDGGSEDGSLDIIKKYEKSITSFESRKDRGQSHAINLGMAKSSGEIMAWINSDDILLPGALNYIGNFFRLHPEVDVVYGHRVLINEYDFEIGRWIMPEHDEQVLSWADFVPQETLFWRRDVWDRAGSRVDEDFHFAMDWDLLLRFKEVNAKMVRLPRLIGGFRVHGSQKTNINIKETGSLEMAVLRERELGYAPSEREIHEQINKYIRAHQIENFRWKVRKLFMLL